MLARELYALLETAGDASFVVDPQGRINYWSESAERLLGFSKQQTLSKYCADILAGEDDAACSVCAHDCAVRDRAAKHGQVASFDLHVKTASGQRKWINISTLVARLERGPSPLIVHLLRDIEHRKQIETATRNILVQVGGLTGQQADEVLSKGASEHPPVDLTDREISVLRLLSAGRNTKGIAEELHISVATVRNHIQHILAKLHCHTRLEAVLRAARQGWI